MRRLERALREQNAVVGDDADGIAEDAREARHQRSPVERLELVEAAAVYQPRDDLADIEALARVGGDDAVEAARIVLRLLRRGDLPGILLAPVQVADDGAYDGQRMLVV